MARTIPRAFDVIPVDDTAQVRAGARQFRYGTAGVAIDGEFFQALADDRAAAGLDCIDALHLAGRQVFGEGRDGELYILDHGGTLARLVPDPAAKANANFPRRLSETGLFQSVRNHTPASGVIKYAINAEPWADHAVAERLFATPGAGTLGLYEKSNLQAGVVKGEWIFPGDTVLAKTLSLELERGNPATRRRVENPGCLDLTGVGAIRGPTRNHEPWRRATDWSARAGGVCAAGFLS